MALQIFQSFTSTTTIILVASFCYVAVLTLYRLLIHPLRSFPGPRLAAATYWYETYHDLFTGPYPGQGAFHIEVLHKEYGE